MDSITVWRRKENIQKYNKKKSSRANSKIPSANASISVRNEKEIISSSICSLDTNSIELHVQINQLQQQQRPRYEQHWKELTQNSIELKSIRVREVSLVHYSCWLFWIRMKLTSYLRIVDHRIPNKNRLLSAVLMYNMESLVVLHLILSIESCKYICMHGQGNLELTWTEREKKIKNSNSSPLNCASVVRRKSFLFLHLLLTKRDLQWIGKE